MSPHCPENSPVAPSYGPNTYPGGGPYPPPDPPPTHDNMAPRPPQSARISDPRGTSDPKRGSLRPQLASDKIWSAGVSPRTAPKTGKIHFFSVFGPFRALCGREISLSPQDPKTSTPRIAAAGGRTIESAKRTNIAQRKPGSDEPKNSRNLAGRNKFFAGWVPNRQNRSQTDEMAPNPPAERPCRGSPHTHGTPDGV